MTKKKWLARMLTAAAAGLLIGTIAASAEAGSKVTQDPCHEKKAVPESALEEFTVSSYPTFIDLTGERDAEIAVIARVSKPTEPGVRRTFYAFAACRGKTGGYKAVSDIAAFTLTSGSSADECGTRSLRVSIPGKTAREVSGGKLYLVGKVLDNRHGLSDTIPPVEPEKTKDLRRIRMVNIPYAKLWKAGKDTAELRGFRLKFVNFPTGTYRMTIPFKNSSIKGGAAPFGRVKTADLDAMKKISSGETGVYLTKAGIDEQNMKNIIHLTRQDKNGQRCVVAMEYRW